MRKGIEMRLYNKVMIDGEEQELFIYKPMKDGTNEEGLITFGFDAQVMSDTVLMITIGYDYKGFDGAEYRKNKYFVYDEIDTEDHNFDTEEKLFKYLLEFYGQVIPEDTPELQEWRKLVASVL